MKFLIFLQTNFRHSTNNNAVRARRTSEDSDDPAGTCASTLATGVSYSAVAAGQSLPNTEERHRTAGQTSAAATTTSWLNV